MVFCWSSVCSANVVIGSGKAGVVSAGGGCVGGAMTVDGVSTVGGVTTTGGVATVGGATTVPPPPPPPPPLWVIEAPGAKLEPLTVPLGALNDMVPEVVKAAVRVIFPPGALRDIAPDVVDIGPFTFKLSGLPAVSEMLPELPSL